MKFQDASQFVWKHLKKTKVKDGRNYMKLERKLMFKQDEINMYGKIMQKGLFDVKDPLIITIIQRT